MEEPKKLELKKDGIYEFSDVLYNGYCPDCNEHVEWEAHFDADGTYYSGTCACEDKDWSFGTVTVHVDCYKKD